MRKLLFFILHTIVSTGCFAQANLTGEGLDLVIKSKDFGYDQLRGTLDVTQLPGTLYSSLITVEGTTNNYIRSLPAGAHGYFATIASEVSLKKAKSSVEQWKLIMDRALKKEGLAGKKSKMAVLPHAGYLLMPTGESTFQIFVTYHKMENNSLYEADISIMSVLQPLQPTSK